MRLRLFLSFLVVALIVVSCGKEERIQQNLLSFNNSNSSDPVKINYIFKNAGLNVAYGTIQATDGIQAGKRYPAEAEYWIRLSANSYYEHFIAFDTLSTTVTETSRELYFRPEGANPVSTQYIGYEELTDLQGFINIYEETVIQVIDAIAGSNPGDTTFRDSTTFPLVTRLDLKL